MRNQAKNFASVSLTASARHKVLIIDEADNTTPDVQLLLGRRLRVSKELSIHLCNFKNKIIEPHSRTTVVEFNVRGQTKQDLAGAFFGRCQDILKRGRSPSNLELLLKS